ncbi:ABC transporter substrate-binding protein [Pseudactinotalea terrae]|uniref:ABC transporter substrate-binding protein n=1 Tax=Pseudactinotalea terrae TaxID=1743262 RepID=UPI001390E4FA|nr:ABC transporter substrate-binding protein [Pseudactinotalea terrae]
MITMSRRTLLTGALGAGAAMALASCDSGGGTDPVAEQSANTAALPTYVPYAGVEPDLPAELGRTSAAFFAYPDPATFSTEAPGDGQPVRFMGPTSFGLPPALPDNPFWQEMNKRIGSDLDISLTPAGEYDAKFSTTVAGNSLPDAFYVGSMPARAKFMVAKAADLTEYLSGDAVQDYPGLASIPTDSWQECIFEGSIRAIPLNRGLVSLPSVLMRNDLLTSAGIDRADITSFEALREISSEMTGGNRWAWGDAPLGHLRRMADIPIRWTIEDGVLDTNLLDERQHEALEATRALVADGSVNPDAAGIPASTKKQWFGGGQAAFISDSFIAWFSLYVANEAVEGLEIQAMGIPGMTGGTGTQNLPRPNAGFTAFSAEVGDRLPTLLRIADWLAAPFGTEEYLFNKYGIAGRNYDVVGSDPVPSALATEVNIGSLYMSDAARVIYSPGRPEAVQSAWDHQSAVTAKTVPDPTYGLESATASRVLNSLTGELSSVEQDIIYGRRPVSDWDAAAQAFLDGGGTTIVEEYQASYDAIQAMQ